MGGGGALAGGVLDESRVHMHIYTHVGTRIAVGKIFETLELQFIINHFN